MTERRDTLRCLAIRQPWAWAIVIGAKDIENRAWSTDHRGLFVIQASGAKTLVNGQQISGRHDLRRGDLIEVSGLTLEFRLKPATH